MNITTELLNGTSAGRATWEESLYADLDGDLLGSEINTPYLIVATFSYTPTEPRTASYPGVEEDVDVESIELEGLSGPVADRAVTALQIRVQYIEMLILEEIQRQRRESEEEADAA